ncbi:MAG: class I SAM-dependent methyltransferase [Phycisphaerales bacterium JB039]
MPDDLHTLNPTGRFTDRAADYDRCRPGYPEAAIDMLLARRGDPAPLTVADVGAGTGILSRALARRGATIIAIEPNDAMRAAASPAAGVRWVAATGEATGLEPASVDLVTCAQAFHWLRPDEAIAEFCRILKPGGRIALLWNIGDERDPVTRGYYDAIRRASDGFTSSHGRIGDAPLEHPLLCAQERHILPNAQQLDVEGLIGRALSASYVPRHQDSPQRARLIEDLRALHHRYTGADGTVALVYETRIHLAVSRASR